jgi:hypothetical protein
MPPDGFRHGGHDWTRLGVLPTSTEVGLDLLAKRRPAFVSDPLRWLVAGAFELSDVLLPVGVGVPSLVELGVELGAVLRSDLGAEPHTPRSRAFSISFSPKPVEAPNHEVRKRTSRTSQERGQEHSGDSLPHRRAATLPALAIKLGHDGPSVAGPVALPLAGADHHEHDGGDNRQLRETRAERRSNEQANEGGPREEAKGAAALPVGCREDRAHVGIVAHRGAA